MVATTFTPTAGPRCDRRCRRLDEGHATASRQRRPARPFHDSGTMSSTTRGLSGADLAPELAAVRPTAIRGELARLAEHAATRGVTPLLLAILTDEHQPDIVRQRAFGRIAAQLDQRRQDRP